MKKTIEKALKRIVVPHLRKKGFRGPYPNFYRHRGKHVDLLHIQFHGFYFFCEISYTDTAWGNITWENEEREKQIFLSIRNTIILERDVFDSKKVRTFMTNCRARLECVRMNEKDDAWFFESAGGTEVNAPEVVAEELKSTIEGQAELWWSEQYQNS